MSIDTARGQIRAEVIDNMTHEELRSLVSKTEEAVESGFVVDEETFEEHVGEVLATRAKGTEK